MVTNAGPSGLTTAPEPPTEPPPGRVGRSLRWPQLLGSSAGRDLGDPNGKSENFAYAVWARKPFG